MRRGDDKRHTPSYPGSVKPFRWSTEKNLLLEAERGITFERIAVAVGDDGVLDIVEHPNQERYASQRIMIVACEGYAYLVPYVEDRDHVFLKTIIPSRKATRDYLRAPGRKKGE